MRLTLGQGSEEGWRLLGGVVGVADDDVVNRRTGRLRLHGRSVRC